MKETLKTVMIHRITIGWLLLFTGNSLFTSIMAALAGTDWGTSDRQTRFLIVISILANWTGVLMAFFNQAASRIRGGRDILAEGTTPPPFDPPSSKP